MLLHLPGPPNQLPCATEVGWPGFDAMDDVRVPITRTQMSRKRTKISFDATETRSGTTVRWTGTFSFERGHQCTVPPDYPCHTMLA